MFHVEMALDDAALMARLCYRDQQTRRQHLAMAIARRHAFLPT